MMRSMDHSQIFLIHIGLITTMVQNSRTGRKVHKIKANRQAETNFTPIKHYQGNMPPDPTKKQEKKSNSKSLNVDRKPPKENY